MAPSADQRRVLSCSRDVRLWDLETGRCLRALEGHNVGVVNAELSSDERRAVSCDWNGGVWVWDLSE